jgi:outer membrane scaffolding protein for murein synthesis (MipA/OmpV family)
MRAALWGCGLLLTSQLGQALAAGEAVPAAGADILVPRPLWELGLGVAALRLPDYRGSDQSSTYVLPLPYVVYRGEWLRADRDGARVLLLKAERVKVDVGAAATAPARSDDNAARSGMPNLPATVEFGPNVNVELLRSADRRVRLDLRLPLGAPVTVQRSPHAIGLTFSPTLSADFKGVGDGWNVGVLGGPLFADRKYHQYFYGVDAAYATPQRPAYTARGGYAGWRALAAVSRRFRRTWVGAFARYDSLRGAAFAASPLVRRDHGVTVGIGVSWVFATSDRLVVSND